MLYTVDEESLPQVVFPSGIMVQLYVVAPPLMRIVHVEEQPIRGCDALEFSDISSLVPRIAGALEPSTWASNVDGNTVNKANTGLEPRSPPANCIRGDSGSLSHKLPAPLS